jgi:hypothetical protein
VDAGLLVEIVGDERKAHLTALGLRSSRVGAEAEARDRGEGEGRVRVIVKAVMVSPWQRG